MADFKITSQITFLYFENYPEAINFFKDVLKLELVFDPGWAAVFRTSNDAFVGAVDIKKSSIEVKEKGGTLISLTVENLNEWYNKLKEEKSLKLSEIKTFADIHLKSFFFTGPEGYEFEIQQFQDERLKLIF